MKGGTFVRKRISTVLVPFLLVCILFAQAAQATGQKVAGSSVRLTFQETTAVCSSTCLGDFQTDSIDATLRLYKGSTCIDSWSESGTGKITLYGECRVTSGTTYRLEVVCSINGVEQPVTSATRTCP